MEGEVVVELKDGCTVRSGSDTLQSGDYIRICDPDGKEVAYWHYDEWKEEPQLVMGAIINTMAGLRLAKVPVATEDNNNKVNITISKPAQKNRQHCVFYDGQIAVGGVELEKD